MIAAGTAAAKTTGAPNVLSGNQLAVEDEVDAEAEVEDLEEEVGEYLLGRR